jgi:hypothetical protein
MKIATSFKRDRSRDSFPIGGVHGLSTLSRERQIGQPIQNGKLKEAWMKDITTALLASLFILISLFSLISADSMPRGTRWATLSNPGDASELELRYALRR